MTINGVSGGSHPIESVPKASPAKNNTFKGKEVLTESFNRIKQRYDFIEDRVFIKKTSKEFDISPTELKAILKVAKKNLIEAKMEGNKSADFEIDGEAYHVEEKETENGLRVRIYRAAEESFAEGAEASIHHVDKFHTGSPAVEKRSLNATKVNVSQEGHLIVDIHRRLDENAPRLKEKYPFAMKKVGNKEVWTGILPKPSSVSHQSYVMKSYDGTLRDSIDPRNGIKNLSDNQKMVLYGQLADVVMGNILLAEVGEIDMDNKPENILTREEEAVISDYGSIAHIMPDDDLKPDAEALKASTFKTNKVTPSYTSAQTFLRLLNSTTESNKSYNAALGEYLSKSLGIATFETLCGSRPVLMTLFNFPGSLDESKFEKEPFTLLPNDVQNALRTCITTSFTTLEEGLIAIQALHEALRNHST